MLSQSFCNINTNSDWQQLYGQLHLWPLIQNKKTKTNKTKAKAKDKAKDKATVFIIFPTEAVLIA